MLISKRSPRTSERFSSRFGDGAPGDFPLRQYLRLREDLGVQAMHTCLTALMAVLLLVFGRSLDGLFQAHGAHLSPWYRRMVWVAILLLALSVLRRLCYKVVELRQIRRDMRELRADFRQPGDDDGADGDCEHRGRGTGR
ncbi:MAG: hypothetical protein IPK64_09675 [bacterium]|nr:hypothetical protein [bacterium]